MKSAEKKKLKSWINIQVKAYENRAVVIGEDILKNINYTDGIHVSSETLTIIIEELDYKFNVYPFITDASTNLKHEVVVPITRYTNMFSLFSEKEMEALNVRVKNH